MITNPNKGWRNVLMFCAAAVVAVLVSSCRAPAPEAGRYQWTYVPKDSGTDELYVIDTVTREVAKWNGSSWSPAHNAPLSTPDWNAIRKDREWQKKIQEEAKKKREDACLKREALAKSYSQMPLEKQVAWAKTISIGKLSGKRFVGKTSDNKDNYVDEFTILETLKRRVNQKDIKWPYKATDDGIVVFFSGIADEGPLEFGLSRTPMKRNDIFSAPATIIDDVKAEIKRQEEKKK